ncbi:EAL domain-containing protein [Acidithiobacillus ferriphilus]|uniref:EAL domain-containing protein n=1 Tax=Acidithiobacillus ferriphilus TaxID=1689834 RepID=UPI002DBAE045|nr:EAL domain-containing protein [Acidithiobacillus ferriphilus]MEB8476596.1 EAL domain-containing protein [Acidithiobacillus ferriphilus]
MSYPYRLEPIVDLLTGDVVGQELLAGRDCCPTWSEAEWREWYAFLVEEIPRLLPDLHPCSGQPELLFLNLDGHQLLDGHISGSIRSLRDHASRIVIEWTEQRFRDEQLVDVLAKLNFLKGLGFRLAIDDIGAGVGIDGLGRAGAVKASFCKIDGTYFQKFRNKGPEPLRDLCRHLSHGGSRVIVEWVETEADYRLALAAGAHLGQGYLWTRTAPRKGTAVLAASLPIADITGMDATAGQGEC